MKRTFMTIAVALLLTATSQAQDISVQRAAVDRAGDRLMDAETNAERATDELFNAKLAVLDADRKLEAAQIKRDAVAAATPVDSMKLGFWDAQVLNWQERLASAKADLKTKQEKKDAASIVLAQDRKTHRDAVSTALGSTEDKVRILDTRVADHERRLTNVEAAVAKLREDYDKKFDEFRHLTLDEAKAMVDFRLSTFERAERVKTEAALAEFKADIEKVYLKCKTTCDARATVVTAAYPVYPCYRTYCAPTYYGYYYYEPCYGY